QGRLLQVPDVWRSLARLGATALRWVRRRGAGGLLVQTAWRVSELRVTTHEQRGRAHHRPRVSERADTAMGDVDADGATCPCGPRPESPTRTPRLSWPTSST